MQTKLESFEGRRFYLLHFLGVIHNFTFACDSFQSYLYQHHHSQKPSQADDRSEEIFFRKLFHVSQNEVKLTRYEYKFFTAIREKLFLVF